jgi:hypothetical protein
MSDDTRTTHEIEKAEHGYRYKILQLEQTLRETKARCELYEAWNDTNMHHAEVAEWEAARLRQRLKVARRECTEAVGTIEALTAKARQFDEAEAIAEEYRRELAARPSVAVTGTIRYAWRYSDGVVSSMMFSDAAGCEQIFGRVEGSLVAIVDAAQIVTVPDA